MCYLFDRSIPSFSTSLSPFFCLSLIYTYTYIKGSSTNPLTLCTSIPHPLYLSLILPLILSSSFSLPHTHDRFIELMPFDGNEWSRKKFIGYLEVLDSLKEQVTHSYLSMPPFFSIPPSLNLPPSLPYPLSLLPPFYPSLFLSSSPSLLLSLLRQSHSSFLDCLFFIVVRA